jgi:hypothetical protein
MPPDPQAMTLIELRRIVLRCLKAAEVPKPLIRAFEDTDRFPGPHGWAQMDGHLREKYAAAIGVNVDEAAGQLASWERFGPVFEALTKDNPDGPRTRAILAMLLSTGMSAGQIVRLRIADLDPDHQRLRPPQRDAFSEPGERYENTCADCRFIGPVDELDFYHCAAQLGSEHGERFATPLLVGVGKAETGQLTEVIRPVAVAAESPPDTPMGRAFRLGTAKGMIPPDFLRHHASAVAGELFSPTGKRAFKRLRGSKLIGDLADRMEKDPEQKAAADKAMFGLVTRTKLRDIADDKARREFEAFVLRMFADSGFLDERPGLVYAWRKTGCFPMEDVMATLTKEETYAHHAALDEWERMGRSEKRAFLRQCRKLAGVEKGGPK